MLGEMQKVVVMDMLTTYISRQVELTRLPSVKKENFQQFSKQFELAKHIMNAWHPVDRTVESLAKAVPNVIHLFRDQMCLYKDKERAEASFAALDGGVGGGGGGTSASASAAASLEGVGVGAGGGGVGVESVSVGGGAAEIGSTAAPAPAPSPTPPVATGPRWSQPRDPAELPSRAQSAASVPSVQASALAPPTQG